MMESVAEKDCCEQQQQDSCSRSVEREHMFDKVVTPSDVGKLNRLVIPKQHAEKYFPLDSSSQDKGLLLNFEDRSGKPWRFRYSYWNSSQSYVMTKGWSRFVKDKNLHAGDIVSFHRAHHRLFIDWRRRPHTPLRWGSPLPPPPPHLYNYYPHRQIMNLGSQPVYYLRASSSSSPAFPTRHVIDSVPLLHGRSGAAGKRLRLFGVNMECEMTNEDNAVLLPSTPHVSPQFSDKGKSSLSFDLAL